MVLFKRLLYLLYYLKVSDFKQLKAFVRYSKSLYGKSNLSIWTDVLNSVFKYNISLKDYFCFRFFELKDMERKKWAGTGFIYEYQLIMNPKGARKILENKILFLNHFRTFIDRKFLTLDEIRSDRTFTERMLLNSTGRIVLKDSQGQAGAEVEVISCNQYTPESLVRYMETRQYDLVEEYVIQHPALMELSPSGLNTIRIITQLHEGNVDFLGARFRVSVNSHVDNMAAGNLAAPIDLETGIVNGPAIYSDITKEDKTIHPVTGIAITGFVIPFWKSVVELTRAAALHIPDNKSVGWDIAVTEKGPELIEGNHNWCKLLWQLPVKQGLKAELNKYL